jgi:ribonucleotide reductase alpha subunit
MEQIDEMYVTKRNGKREIISFNKISNRLKNIGKDANVILNFTSLAMKVIDQLYDNIETTKIDELTSEQCAAMTSLHPDYGIIAGYVAISNHQKKTSDSFYESMRLLYKNEDIHKKISPLVSDQLWRCVTTNRKFLEKIIDYKRDYLIDYFGFKTLEKSYLLRTGKQIIERPQHMWLRVSIGIHGSDLDKIEETYNYLSNKYFTHATPTLFNAGTPQPQLSSCYLLAMEDDSIDGIFNTLKDCAQISKWAGGIGLHVHNVRAKGSYIRGTNGVSNGIMPMLRVFNNAARYVDQCITADTHIFTTDGPKRIADIVEERDHCFNRFGKPELVKKTLEYSYEGKIYKLNSKYFCKGIRITPEHSVLRYPNATIFPNESYATLNWKVDPEWVTVKELIYGDYLLFPKPLYTKDIERISLDDCYFYGLMLVFGYTDADNSNFYIKMPDYKFLSNDDNYEKEITDYLSRRFINYTKVVEEYSIHIKWPKSPNFPFKSSDLISSFTSFNTYKLYYIQRLNVFQNITNAISARMLNLPIEKLCMIVSGIFKYTLCISDCYKLRYNECCRLDEEISDQRFESYRYLLMRLGIMPYVESRHEYVYYLCIDKTQTFCDILGIVYEEATIKNNDIKTVDGNMCVPISSMTIEDYSGTVYDLEMDTEHNYMSSAGIMHNGGGKRNGSFAIYIEPWHADIEIFLDMRKNQGDEESRARDLFYALWIPDLFMERVKSNGVWTLMCPDECPHLSDKYGEEFNKLYTEYEVAGRGKKQLQARELWFRIMDSQMETGTPYLLYKDACNQKSNQKNLGTIKSSNLCTEIIEYSDKDESAVCNLASISLGKFVDDMSGEYDYVALHKITKIIVHNLNKIIDVNFYPIEKTQRSNFLHRPVGVGVQGLADTFFKMNIAFYSEVAVDVNKKIFETIYHGALEASCDISEKRGIILREFYEESRKQYGFDWQDYREKLAGDLKLSKNMDALTLDVLKAKYPEVYGSMSEDFKQYMACSDAINQEHLIMADLQLTTVGIEGAYSSYNGSPASKGILQFDMWDDGEYSNDRYDWDAMKLRIISNGIRNSLLVAPMPTASTSQILGNNECFEPVTSNIYTRRTIAGEFMVINQYLIRELIDQGMWDESIKQNIVANGGSIQHLDFISEEMRLKYRTVWEIPMKHIINMARDRGKYICQSQSLNLWMEDPDYSSLTAMHFYSWSQGLKTGIYYLRRKARHQAQQFTVEPDASGILHEEQEYEICEMCSG